MTIRIDLHVHTGGSFDSRADPDAVYRRCVELGLCPVFITDHDTIEMADFLHGKYGSTVVVGEEITTSDGEIIGLYLAEEIPPGLPAAETVARIHEQGGLVYLEHPLDVRRRSLTMEAIDALADCIDIVEVHNTRAGQAVNDRARDLQRTLGLPAGAGSDAHRVDQIGSVYVELPRFNGPRELIAALATGRIVIHPSRTLMRLRGRLGRFGRG